MVNTLPKSLPKFLYWWAYKTPKWLFTVMNRLMRFVDNEASFTLNLRLFFTPLYGDYTIIGRFIGLVLRIFFILFGLIFVAFLSILSLILPLVWYLLPVALIYFFDFWSIPIILGAFLYVTYLNLNVPDKKVSEVENSSALSSFRPEVKRFYISIKNGSSYAINTFLNDTDIIYVFKKAELLDSRIKDSISKTSKLDKINIIPNAYNVAKKQNSKYVEKEHLFLALLQSIEHVDTLLSSYETSLDTIEKTIEWIIEQREYFAKLYFWQEDFEMPIMSGIGHGLTGRVTPDLDMVSRDFTKLVKKGYLKEIVGREQEIEKIASYLGGSNENILLIGEPGCGKTSIVMGMAHKIMHGTKYKTLQNKRIVSLEMGSLIAGSKSQGQIAERLKNAMNDVIGSGDIILFIDEIHSLVSSVNETEGFSTVFSILEPYLSSNEVQFIAATNIENYRKFIEPLGSFSRLFETIEIPESNFEDTIKILKHNADVHERKYHIEITMAALLEIYKMSTKLIHTRVLPDKALDILNRTSSRVANTTKLLTTKEVDIEISEMTHIPVTAVTEDESEKLLNIEKEMQKKVIGQDHALAKIGAALKRARVGIRNEGKPIASFLFVGTTGVGKTETAKTLSETYFGDRKAMIRLDMSEYQTEDSIDKLIGTSDGKTNGILTEAVRTKPFAVILLDEIEKANQKIIMAFLQVLDDGRLTDSSGRTVDFTNSVIIATSNVGTKEIQLVTEQNGTYEQMVEVAMKSVKEKFSPEFLNRFTSIVVYKPLDIENVKKIARILLESVKSRAEEKRIKITFNDDLIDELVNRGFNPQWGARPMARVIEDTVETYIAEKIIGKEYKSGDIVNLGKEVFENVEDGEQLKS